MSEKNTAIPQKKSTFSRKLSIFFLMVTAVVFIYSTVVALVCLIPSLVAAVIDRQQPRTAWITVGAMNLAGTLPALFRLWETGHRFGDALQIVMKPDVLMIAYGGAAGGWIIYNNITSMVAAIVLGKNEKRLKDIDKRRQDLVRKWGEKVISS
jgi:hypothetical protein